MFKCVAWTDTGRGRDQNMGEEKGLAVSFLTLPVARTYLHLVGPQTISFLSCLGNVSDTQKLGK